MSVINRKVQVIVADKMQTVKKMKKSELLQLVASLLEDNILEMNDVVIEEMYTEAKLV